MPATAYGSANGRSTQSIDELPTGKSVAHQHQATSRPKMPWTIAARKIF